MFTVFNGIGTFTEVADSDTITDIKGQSKTDIWSSWNNFSFNR